MEGNIFCNFQEIIKFLETFLVTTDFYTFESLSLQRNVNIYGCETLLYAESLARDPIRV